ncbi:hypothetical protein [Streptomyces sp. CC228A]|uniref:hypothetical protein n=1 Tax=Streptomyces sp. CC228A TaxID=2898186 RepID=UPI001F264400|nr:hypothetical protein [Streptomyces sp. CC228A]
MPLYIAFDSHSALGERCDFTAVRTTRGDDPRYEEGAVVPSGPWLPLAEVDSAELIAPASLAPSTLVELVRPPMPSGADLSRLGTSLGDDQAHYLGQARATPDMLTTTVNHQNGRRIGLHLDNWDKLISGRKHTGRRRLALNLGPGARYIVLGTLDAQAVCRALYPEDHEYRYPHTDDCRAYVAAGHPARCVRIRLLPGEGYIAPTEYLLHDGSTEEQGAGSTMAFWLGRWPARTLPSLV